MILLFVLAVMPGCSEHRGVADASSESQRATFTQFSSLERPASPNTYLVAPAGQEQAAPADSVAFTFHVPADKLANTWVEIVRAQPRTRVLGVSGDGLQIEAEQRSALFGFIDRISFRAMPLAPEQSTFFAYSRSHTGYWDLGVNRRRLSTWISELTVTMDKTTASQ